MLDKGRLGARLPLLAGVGILDALRHENHLVDSLDQAVAHARSHAVGQGSSTALP